MVTVAVEEDDDRPYGRMDAGIVLPRTSSVGGERIDE